MRQYQLLSIVASSLLLPLAGCGTAQSNTAAVERVRQDGEAAVSSREDWSVEGRLRAIASELHNGGYKIVGGWERAISSCSDWGLSGDFSDAAVGTPHGTKIYLPWAKDADAYLLSAKEDQPIGQIIVKESWVPKELAFEEYLESGSILAERDGKRYKADKPADLFIMFKDDPATPNTDEGWVYGIVTPDAKEVISSGHIKACADCHRQARHDRVFGEKPKPE